MTDKPKTPATTLQRARQIALSAGLKYCYVGNVFDDEGQTTYCPACGKALIRRSWHDILEYNLVGDSCSCGQTIPGRFVAKGSVPSRDEAEFIPSGSRTSSLPSEKVNYVFYKGNPLSINSIALMAKIAKPSTKPYPHLTILEDISTLISHSRDLQQTLNSIVATVAERMETEVCSIYILDRQNKRLTLRATMGLDEESVDKVSMGTGEGLTGLVIERMKPVMVVDALKHPRYKYFPETHEERFHSFLGVPLIEQKLPLGVLIVQTSRRREFSRDEIRLLTTISAQVSSILVQARLADSLRSTEEERTEYHKRMVEALRKLRSYEGRRRERAAGAHQHWRGRLKGLAASPGFAAVAPRSQTTDGNQRHPEEKAKNPEREMERFRAAVEEESNR
jgi:putative methionine-R-sulfoxide reductase with GAF domain